MKAALLCACAAAKSFSTNRPIRLPVDVVRQRNATVDASPRKVRAALAAYDVNDRRCGGVVLKAHARHERNQDGLGAQWTRRASMPRRAPRPRAGVYARTSCRRYCWRRRSLD